MNKKFIQETLSNLLKNLIRIIAITKLLILQKKLKFNKIERKNKFVNKFNSPSDDESIQ